MELAQLELAQVVEEAKAAHGDGFLVLVFDQFEEILTIDPTDWESQAGFFMELGAVLARRPRLGALLDAGGLHGRARPLRPLPAGAPPSTYRLDFLTRWAAKAAIQLPARYHGVEFTDDAATNLVCDSR